MPAAQNHIARDEPHLGEHAACQPLSGRANVTEAFAVHGAGRGGYVRQEESDCTAKTLDQPPHA